jgi:signal transduction histidine kinase
LSFVHNDELDVKAQNVVKLMEDVLEIFQFCNLRDIKYQLHVEKNLPLISGNGELLQQIFFNLLKNAVDASEEGGEIKIKIYPSIRHLTNNVCAVEFAIEDNGSGISPESIESVFDLFVTTKPHGDGTGLGLPMARRIVEAHGGTLHLESELGKGTKAIVRLPVWSKSSK